MVYPKLCRHSQGCTPCLLLEDRKKQPYFVFWGICTQITNPTYLSALLFRLNQHGYTATPLSIKKFNLFSFCDFHHTEEMMTFFVQQAQGFLRIGKRRDKKSSHTEYQRLTQSPSCFSRTNVRSLYASFTKCARSAKNPGQSKIFAYEWNNRRGKPYQNFCISLAPQVDMECVILQWVCR